MKIKRTPNPLKKRAWGVSRWCRWSETPHMYYIHVQGRCIIIATDNKKCPCKPFKVEDKSAITGYQYVGVSFFEITALNPNTFILLIGC